MLYVWGMGASLLRCCTYRTRRAACTRARHTARTPYAYQGACRTYRVPWHPREPGCELEKAIKALAKAWKDTLKKGDAELGIDAEFTRPGIESLLQQLEDDFSSCEPTQDFKFKWRA